MTRIRGCVPKKLAKMILLIEVFPELLGPISNTFRAWLVCSLIFWCSCAQRTWFKEANGPEYRRAIQVISFDFRSLLSSFLWSFPLLAHQVSRRCKVVLSWGKNKSTKSWSTPGRHTKMDTFRLWDQCVDGNVESYYWIVWGWWTELAVEGQSGNPGWQKDVSIDIVHI